MKRFRILRWLLLPFGMAHLLGIWLRNKLFDWNLRKAQQLPRPVISIGNIQMGGTGKTPLVIELLERIHQRKRRAGVLSRGYARKSKNPVIALGGEAHNVTDLGDEPRLLLNHLKDGVLGIGANRYETGLAMLSREPAIDVFLLDDGFQHRRLHRDVDICLIDVSTWANHPFLYPFSNLRDTKGALKRADLIILTKFERCPDKAQQLKQRLSTQVKGPVVMGTFQPRRLYRLSDGQGMEFGEIILGKTAAMCGIATPEHFWFFLKSLEVKLVYHKAFPDHHYYTPEEVRTVLLEARHQGARWLVVTEKDAVKLRECLADAPEIQKTILVLAVRFEISEPETLAALLDGALPVSGNQKENVDKHSR